MAASILKSIGDQALANQRAKSTWGEALFASMDELKPDYSGKVGERLLARVCQVTGIDHVYVDDDKNSKDGTYDITILGKKIEVKTARMGAPPKVKTGPAAELAAELTAELLAPLSLKQLRELCGQKEIATYGNKSVLVARLLAWKLGDKPSKRGQRPGSGVLPAAKVKTARQGEFQHENLRDAGCDLHVFIDIKPSEFFVTVLPKFDMKSHHPVFGRKPHLRKGTSDVYKVNLGESNLLKGIKKGMTLKVEAETSVEAIGEFIIRQIGRE